jgi:hypothetical protein
MCRRLAAKRSVSAKEWNTRGHEIASAPLHLLSNESRKRSTFRRKARAAIGRGAFDSKKNGVDGKDRVGDLLAINCVLYGTTQYGGNFDKGTAIQAVVVAVLRRDYVRGGRCEQSARAVRSEMSGHTVDRSLTNDDRRGPSGFPC